MTAAAKGEIGKLRHDPFSMIPFCGYNMGDYFGHWISMGRKASSDKLPKIYSVNWFRKSLDGNYLWPGFGENIRILKWIFERTEGVENAEETFIGNLPKKEALDLSGLNLPEENLKALFHLDPSSWLQEVESMRTFLDQFGERTPKEIVQQVDLLEKRIKNV